MHCCKTWKSKILSIPGEEFSATPFSSTDVEEGDGDGSGWFEGTACSQLDGPACSSSEIVMHMLILSLQNIDGALWSQQRAVTFF